jgi:hypothetical protein
MVIKRKSDVKKDVVYKVSELRKSIELYGPTYTAQAFTEGGGIELAHKLASDAQREEIKYLRAELKRLKGL